jgi:thiol-disulfide isomerase/thioredoxin
MILRILYMIWLIAILPEYGLSQTAPQNKPYTFAYNLTVGEKIFYTSRTRLEYTGGTVESREILEIWVLKQNADRSWQLLLHNSETSADVDSKGKRTELPARSSWGLCNFHPNGRFARNWSMDNLSRFDLYLPNIFIPLPNDFSQASLTWQFVDRIYGGKDRYTANIPDLEERSWVVRATYESPLDVIYLLNQKAEVYIDLLKAVPVYKKGESTRGYGRYAGKSTTTGILDSVIDLDTVQASRFARDLAIFLAADSQYNEIIYRVEANPSLLIPLRQDAENLFNRLKTRIATSEIKNQLIERIASLPDDFEELTKQIHRRAKIVNRSAPKWRAEDFGGQQYSSEDLAGKVILLDFWYRACPWCIRSMPMIDDVALHFKDKPVAVVGVNTDKDRADAIFVIQRMNPSYINISGRELIKKFDVTSYPTFIVIDKNGLVRRILIGYEPILYTKLVEIIESLL